MAIPAGWRGRTVQLALNGIDDGFTLWVNGEELLSLGGAGDSFHDRRVVLDLPADLVHAGAENLVVLRVLDAPDAPVAGGLTGLPLLLTVRTEPVTHRVRRE